MRTLLESRSPGALFFSCPRCSVISSFSAVSNTFLVNCLSSPSGPVRDKPCSLGQPDQLLRSDLLSRRVGLLLRRHVVQCRSHHGTFPADSVGASGRKHRWMHSPVAARNAADPCVWTQTDTGSQRAESRQPATPKAHPIIQLVGGTHVLSDRAGRLAARSTNLRMLTAGRSVTCTFLSD